MKRFGLTLVAFMALAWVSAAAQETTPAKWDGSINKAKLTKYLKLSADQNEQVASICDFFELEMQRANNAKGDKNERIREAVYDNLKLMKKTLNAEQYENYSRVMSMTLQNKGINIEQGQK